MRKVFALMLILLVAIGAGCLTSDDDDKDDDGGAGAGVSATDYMPLPVGATFTYASTSVSEWSGDSTQDITISFPGTRILDGKTYTIMVEDDNAWPDTSYVRVQDDILYGYEEFWDDVAKRALESDTLTAAHKQAITGAAEQTQRDVPLVNFGTGSWAIYSYSSSNEYHDTTMNWTGKYVGRETVTVPSGTFENCVKVQLTLNSQSSFKQSEPVWEETWLDISTLWFAEGVGVVKQMSVEQVSDVDGTMETMETVTDVLKSSSMPQ
jgi:hypothetical protein